MIMNFLIEFEQLCQKLWAFMSNLPKPLTSNSENFYRSLNSVLNFRKVNKFRGNWLKNKKATDNKTNWGVKTPPPPPPVLIGSIISV